MKKQIPIESLRIGMYVCAIEAQWLKTPFWCHAFLVQSDEQITKLSKYCRRVTIDTEREVVFAQEVKQAQNNNSIKTAKSEKRLRTAYNKQKTMHSCRTVHGKGVSVLNEIFSDVRFGKSLDTDAAKHVVTELTTHVISNTDAMLYLAQMRKKYNCLAQKSVNVCIFSLVFGKHIGIANKKMLHLGLGALLHDIGMLYITPEVLAQSRTLTEEQRQKMQRHPQLGVDILNKAPDIPQDVKDIVLCHHERIDGQGYPSGLAERKMSLLTRMVAITSVYEALTRQRSYQQMYSPIEALQYLYSRRAVEFDERLVEKFIHALSIYPIGCVVETSSGEIALVVKACNENRLRPTIELLSGNKCGHKLDLSDKQHMQMGIKAVISPSDPRVSPILEKLAETVL
ncbi:HD-GYP domain-containing protein [Pseudoalteromonas luteoviolacea]|uniref:HD-GYP domain protein n=1 Tax=Pseudoalteromonas luteoviolacea (strain 2ta16) TaxID=1353533 RepID=V4HIH1_PSEL2|nr:HD-GYP domain-containing protein [Pseudoalteromonas luteoviolacea]ESP90590.1 HD-GYP domain protein [Pseudoalteromonas luteoviolacea 2ta16]